MIVKTKAELILMRQGGAILGEVLSDVLAKVQPGITELELDSFAEKLILARGAEPGFKRVRGYKHTICVSTNDVVVHGVPTDYRLKGGDIVGIDCGVYYKGFHTDMAETMQVKSEKLKVKSGVDRFLETGRRALVEAIRVAKANNRVGHISKVIQDIVEKEGGYSVVRSLVGHGVGKKLHEKPEVPGFLQGGIRETPKLVSGQTLAIEVIYNEKGKEVVLDHDGWTIRTKDGGVSGLFERTVAITQKDPIVLTQEV